MTRPPAVHVAVVNAQVTVQFASGQVIAVLQNHRDVEQLVGQLQEAAGEAFGPDDAPWEGDDDADEPK